MPVMLLYAHFTGQNIPFGCVSAGCNAKPLFPGGFFRYSARRYLRLVKLVPVGGLRNFRRQVHWLHAKNSCSHLSRSRKATRIKLQTRFPTRFWMRALLKILTAVSPARL